MRSKRKINSIKEVVLPHHFEENGDLVVMETNFNIPFVIVRVFVVRASDRQVRGHHAHRQCTQFLTCPSGSVEVLCDDGNNKITYKLDHPSKGLLIPCGIWAEQTYLKPDSVLTVLCDKPYDASDYIRDYSDFLNYRKKTENI
jgi:dTDP-4-dehydrorhamnose 3,5-epimerase-like enzyme